MLSHTILRLSHSLTISPSYSFVVEMAAPPQRDVFSEVLDILTRTTPENYEVVKRELLELSLQKLEKSEVSNVVRAFFERLGEDQLNSESYVRLLVDLIFFTGPKYDNGQLLRREAVAQCQNMWQQRRDKTSVTILGFLFMNGLVHERVVAMVLTQLLPNQSRQAPQDHEVEMFSQLLLTIAPKMTSFTTIYLDQFKVKLKEISATIKEERVQALVHDTLVVIEKCHSTLSTSS